MTIRETARMLLLLALLATVAGCGASAPTPTPAPPPPTPLPTAILATSVDQIVGTWKGIGAEGMYQRFNQDGTWQVARALEDLTNKPDAELTFRFEGTQFILTELKTAGLDPCVSKTATYQVELLPSGNIKFVTVMDACLQRRRTVALEHQRVR